MMPNYFWSSNCHLCPSLFWQSLVNRRAQKPINEGVTLTSNLALVYLTNRCPPKLRIYQVAKVENGHVRKALIGRKLLLGN